MSIYERFRAATGWSQSELAEHLGVSKQAVSSWETGVKKPKPDTALLFVALAKDHKVRASLNDCYVTGS